MARTEEPRYVDLDIRRADAVDEVVLGFRKADEYSALASLDPPVWATVRRPGAARPSVRDGPTTTAELRAALEEVFVHAHENGVDLRERGYTIRLDDRDAPDYEVDLVRLE
jgi:endonuclease YncB( thermonuclease family)